MKTNEFAENLKKWKESYRAIYKTEIAGEEIIWRTLTRKEYVEIVNAKVEIEELAIFEREMAVAKACILWPENPEMILEEFAGIADILSKECMEKSGFGDSSTERL